MLLTRELIISDCNMTPEFSYVNIIAPLVQKSAQKKRNFGVCCVFSRFSLRRQRKKSAIFVEVARRTDSLTKSRKRHLRQYPKHAKTAPHQPSPSPCPRNAIFSYPTARSYCICRCTNSFAVSATASIPSIPARSIRRRPRHVPRVIGPTSNA